MDRAINERRGVQEMSEMIERVAQALCATATRYEEIRRDQEAHDALLDMARAALAALRDPTGEMVDAGARTYGVPTPAIGSLPLSVIDGQPSKAWRAMIDEACK